MMTALEVVQVGVALALVALSIPAHRLPAQLVALLAVQLAGLLGDLLVVSPVALLEAGLPEAH